jgi:hypothetical protein
VRSDRNRGQLTAYDLARKISQRQSRDRMPAQVQEMNAGQFPPPGEVTTSMSANLSRWQCNVEFGSVHLSELGSDECDSLSPEAALVGTG